MINQEKTSRDIDFSYLRMVSNGDEQFIAEMIASLTLEIDQKMIAVLADTAAGRREGIRLQAHSLKNLYAMLGAASLNEIFAEIEMGSGIADSSVISQRIAIAADQWCETKRLLQEKLTA